MAEKDPIARKIPGLPERGKVSGDIAAFVRKVGTMARPNAAQDGRLLFALDATMSRQPTWDLACRLQADMFRAASDVGSLRVQLVYFRGFAECRSSSWIADPAALTSMMTRIQCQGGMTQIGRVLRRVRGEARAEPVRAFVLVGDAMEEGVDELCAAAGELGLLGIKGFLFQEGHDPVAENAFREMARLTGGAYARFSAGSADALRDLLRAAAAYAAGGRPALERIAAAGGADARRLLTQVREG